MKKINKNLLQGLLTIIAIIIIVISIKSLIFGNGSTLHEYATQNPEIAYSISEEENILDNSSNADSSIDELENNVTALEMNDILQNNSNLHEDPYELTALVGESLNGDEMKSLRFTYDSHFYYEPLSNNLRRYITGVSFPQNQEIEDFSYNDLVYTHVLYYDFDGKPAEGELICNKAIANDLLEIFFLLFQNEYQIEKIRLIDEYDGDDILSMEDNNTSCFNYRSVEGTTSLSKHAYGLAIDINPLYNPYITYNDDLTTNVSPKGSEAYEDRSKSFPYKIDENDLCYKLFIERGFIWGGNWNSVKDYQHFQKSTE